MYLLRWYNERRKVWQVSEYHDAAYGDIDFVKDSGVTTVLRTIRLHPEFYTKWQLWRISDMRIIAQGKEGQS